METELLTEIERFLKLTGFSAARFGTEAMADKAFVYQLRKDRRVWPETVKKCRDYMDRVTEELAGAGKA